MNTIMHGWKKQIRTIRSLVLLSSLLVLSITPLAHAVCTNQQSCSTNYGVNEAFFGTGGNLHSCGTAYCSKQAAGETAVGNTLGTAYQAQAGFNTDRYPSLTLLINDSQCNYYNSSTDVGYLSTTSTKTANANFSVKSYLTSGYNVQTIGAGPIYGSHILTPMASAGASAVGTEQFGMNLVANTSPATFGSAVQQLPSTTFGFGVPSSGYGTANSYKYVNGSTIAGSIKSSGTTCYATSYIFNISSLTPAGQYTFNQTIVATATF